jgi:acyl carrier protein
MKEKAKAPNRSRKARKAAAPEERRDGAGEVWTAAQLMSQIAAIVCDLDDNLTPADVIRSATFAGDLGWDDPFMLRLRKPVEQRLHERVSAFQISERVKTVGDLADLVWSKMEPV